MKYVVFYMCRAFKNFDFKLTSEAKIQPVFSGREDMPVAFDFSHQDHTLVTLYVQLLYSDWSKFDWWVDAENLCSILRAIVTIGQPFRGNSSKFNLTYILRLGRP